MFNGNWLIQKIKIFFLSFPLSSQFWKFQNFGTSWIRIFLISLNIEKNYCISGLKCYLSQRPFFRLALNCRACICTRTRIPLGNKRVLLYGYFISVWEQIDIVHFFFCIIRHIIRVYYTIPWGLFFYSLFRFSLHSYTFILFLLLFFCVFVWQKHLRVFFPRFCAYDKICTRLLLCTLLYGYGQIWKGHHKGMTKYHFIDFPAIIFINGNKFAADFF